MREKKTYCFLFFISVLILLSGCGCRDYSKDKNIVEEIPKELSAQPEFSFDFDRPPDEDFVEAIEEKQEELIDSKMAEDGGSDFIIEGPHPVAAEKDEVICEPEFVKQYDAECLTAVIPSPGIEFIPEKVLWEDVEQPVLADEEEITEPEGDLKKGDAPEDPEKEKKDVPQEETEVVKEVEREVKQAKRPSEPVLSSIFELPFNRWNGEFLLYQINWNFVRLGSGVIVCKEAVSGGRNFYHLIALTMPEGILANRGIGFHRIEAFIDKKTLNPHYFYHYSRNRSKEDILEIFYDWQGNEYRWKARKFEDGVLYSTKEDKKALPQDSLDFLSALYLLRILDNRGKDFIIELASREMWELTVKPPKRQRRNVSGLGAQDIHILSPTARSEKDSIEEGSLDIWITADEKRIPVYIEGRVPLGRARVTLASRTKIDPSINLDSNKISEIISRLK